MKQIRDTWLSIIYIVASDDPIAASWYAAKLIFAFALTGICANDIQEKSSTKEYS